MMMMKRLLMMIGAFSSLAAFLIILLSDQRVLKMKNRRKFGLTSTPKIFDHPNTATVSNDYILICSILYFWSHIGLSTIGRSFGWKSQIQSVLCCDTHTLPLVLSLSSSSSLPSSLKLPHLFEFSRVEMRSILVSFLPSANTLITILTLILSPP